MLLLLCHNQQTTVPLEEVREVYFSHLSKQKFLRKLNAGEIDLPTMRVDQSQKTARSVHIREIADLIARRRASALAEFSCVKPSS